MPLPLVAWAVSETSDTPARCFCRARSHSGEVKRWTMVTEHKSRSLGEMVGSWVEMMIRAARWRWSRMVTSRFSVLCHEGLEVVETLVEGYFLGVGQVLAVQHLAEGSVVEPSTGSLLLLDAQLSEDAFDDVHVERYRAANLDAHQVHHELRVQILLTDTQGLDDDVHALVGLPHRSNVGGGAQNADLDVAVGCEMSGLTSSPLFVSGERVVVEDGARQGTRKLVSLRLEQAILEKARESVALAGALTTTDECTGGRGDIVI